VEDDGTLTFWDVQLSQQKVSWYDATKLACCRGPDEILMLGSREILGLIHKCTCP